MQIEFTQEASNFLESLNKKEYEKVKNKLLYLCSNYEVLKTSKNITSLVGFSNVYRYKISDNIRAIFEIKDDKITILILKISYRKDIYNFKK